MEDKLWTAYEAMMVRQHDAEDCAAGDRAYAEEHNSDFWWAAYRQCIRKVDRRRAAAYRLYKAWERLAFGSS